jgi:hypothetical protein
VSLFPSFLSGLNEAALRVPVLPGPMAQQIGLHLGWAIVLAALATALAGSLAPRWRPGGAVALGSVAVLTALATLVPGPDGVAWWLGLAFQSPSLSSAVLAAGWLLWRGLAPRLSAPKPAPAVAAGGGSSGQTSLAVSAAVLALMGWVLMLDTLALLPWSLYPSGFGIGALAGLLVLAVLLCTWPASRMAGVALLLIGLVFAVSRLPTGNLWDALIDPCLWLLAQAVLVRAVLGRGQRPGAPG